MYKLTHQQELSDSFHITQLGYFDSLELAKRAALFHKNSKLVSWVTQYPYCIGVGKLIIATNTGNTCYIIHEVER